MQDTDIEGVEQPEKTLAYSHIKRKIAILLASLLMFTALLLVTSILFYIFVPDGDTWWIWVVWVIWSIIFTIGAVETFNSVTIFEQMFNE
jgi:Fe2+ transport system protein B